MSEQSRHARSHTLDQDPDAARSLANRVAEGHEAQVLASYLQDQLEDTRREIEGRIFLAIENGALDPSLAHQAWVQLHAAHKLAKRLARAERTGQKAAEKLRGSIEPGVERPRFRNA